MPHSCYPAVKVGSLTVYRECDERLFAYCRIGERSSHTWFVLTYLLGFERVRNYDGSWTEWGNLVGAPIETGTAKPASSIGTCS